MKLVGATLSFALLFVFLLMYSGAAQTLAYYKTRKVDTAFTISNGSGLEAVNFFFPTFDDYRELHKGYKVTDTGTLRLLKRNVDVLSPNSILFARIFSSNIKSIQFLLSDDTCRGPVEVHFKRDGYQLPIADNIGCVVKQLQEKGSIKIAYQLRVPHQPFSLVIGELWMGNHHIAQHLSPSRLFQQYPFDNAKGKPQYITSPFDSYGHFAYFPKTQIEEDFKGTVFIEDTLKSSIQLLREVFIPVLEDYPFYKEKGVNKQKTLEEARRLVQSYTGTALCAYIDDLNKYLAAKFHDPHFYIRSKCHEKAEKKSPLYTYRIGRRHLVAAVLDPDLTNTIPLGSEIIKVDSLKLTRKTIKGVDINYLLKKAPGEKVVLRLRLPDKRLTSITYQIKERYKVPANFNPEHLQLKYLNDSTAYYKINKITAHLPLDFVSKLDSINTRKKLILDFRGNGGGDFLAGAQFLSYFINNGFKYFDYKDVRTDLVDSVIVKQNTSPFHYRSDGKVVLLVDRSTACIAELLVHSLRANKKNVLIVGKEPTRGALSFVYEVAFPKDNLTIVTNALNTGKILLSGNTIEDKGVQPDVLVPIKSVLDLQPYEDKVLQVAISK